MLLKFYFQSKLQFDRVDNALLAKWALHFLSKSVSSKDALSKKELQVYLVLSKKALQDPNFMVQIPT